MKNFSISLGIGLNMLFCEYFTVLAQKEEKPKYKFHDPIVYRKR